jgi:hypothetical protein
MLLLLNALLLYLLVGCQLSEAFQLPRGAGAVRSNASIYRYKP